MGVVRTKVVKTVKRALARQGLVLFRTSSKFGIPWADVNRLASDWSYPVSVVFDVGANDGESAISALHHFPKAHVTSFEPHPDTYARLTTRKHDQPRWSVINYALSSEIGEVGLFVYDDSKINSLSDKAQYAVRFGRESRRISVKCTTLDAFCAESANERIDVLKIDTEGFDFAVLQGSRVMLQRQAVKFIYCEFNDLLPIEGASGGALIPIYDLLRPHGYRFVASYNDYIVTDGEMFSVSNALFALPPPR